MSLPCGPGGEQSTGLARRLAEVVPELLEMPPLRARIADRAAQGPDAAVGVVDHGLRDHRATTFVHARHDRFVQRLDVLDARIAEMGLPAEPYWWYRDLRKYGTVPHAGFGLGFERLLTYVTGMENVRDAIPFPRTPGNAHF